MADSSGVRLSPKAIKHLNRGKKTRVNVSEWKVHVRKRKRDKGEAYISSRKKPVCALLPPSEEAVCKCKGNCYVDKVSHERKLQLFHQFREKTYNEQSDFLASNCLELAEPRKRVQDEAISRRQCTVRYYIPVENGGKKVRVCMKNICNIFRVTPRRIQILVEKLKDGTDLSDRRGLHSNRPNAISDEIRNKMREHISSFPKQESHYSRNKTSKEYLSPELNLSKMFLLFCEKYPEIKVSKKSYTDVFYGDFKLKFGLPRSDTCKTCDSMYIEMINTTDEDKLKSLKINSELHHMKAEAGYENLRLDKEAAENNDNLVVLATDLQQVLFCPTLTHSSMFYQRQYSTYNYAVHNLGTGEASMMLWHESIGARGSTEIASCLLKYVIANYTPLEHHEIRKLIVWSDRCVGQNNNWTMIIMFQVLLSAGYFTEIHQKFLVSGHSFLPCDRDFSLIEKQKKTAIVHCPMEWKEVLQAARPSNPFNVICMDQSDFKDFSPAEGIMKKTGGLQVTKFLWLRIDADDPTTGKARKSHNILQPWEYHPLTVPQQNESEAEESESSRPKKKKRQKKIVGPLLNTPPFFKDVSMLKPAYVSQLPIKKAKKLNLLDMCNYLPPEKRIFYENLITEDTEDIDDIEDTED